MLTSFSNSTHMSPCSANPMTNLVLSIMAAQWAERRKVGMAVISHISLTLKTHLGGKPERATRFFSSDRAITHFLASSGLSAIKRACWQRTDWSVVPEWLEPTEPWEPMVFVPLGAVFCWTWEHIILKIFGKSDLEAWMASASVTIPTLKSGSLISKTCLMAGSMIAVLFCLSIWQS